VARENVDIESRVSGYVLRLTGMRALECLS
jgi:hypothetical protein